MCCLVVCSPEKHKMARLPLTDRAVAVGLIQTGVFKQEVARGMGVHRNTIDNLLTKFRTTGNVANLPRRGPTMTGYYSSTRPVYGGAETFVQDKKVDLTAHFQPSPESVELEKENGQTEPVKTSDGQQRGLKRLLTDEERKKKSSSNKKCCTHRISLSTLAWDRWNALKKSLNVASHGELAWLLMDCWFERQGHSEQQTNTSEPSLGQNASLSVEKFIKLEGFKVEINYDNEPTDSATNDSTEKMPKDGDSGIESAIIKNKGFGPNNAALEFKYDYSGNIVETKTADDIKHSKEENESMVNCADNIQRHLKTTGGSDFMIPDETEDKENKDDVIGDETVDNDAEDDVDICDDSASKENELAGSPTTSKETMKCSSENKLEPKRKRLKRCNKNKQEKADAKKNKTKEHWIKIHLADHEDKYKKETMESLERKNRKIDASENLYSCLVCQHYKCSSKDTMEDHLEKHINKVLECRFCQYTAYCATDMREHRRGSGCNQTGKAFVCDICGTFIYSIDTKKNHMGRIHGIAEWQCRYCPELFRTKNERLDHMRHTHPEPCQYCDSCRQSKHRLSKEEFRSHIKNCSSKVPCQICGMLVGLHRMNQHVHDTHENVRKHQCHKCPYSAKSTKRLKTHLLCHENIHPYSCDQCPFTCIQPCQLKSHMRTHTGEKPYKCTQCKYAAAWNVQLKEHVKVHSMETAVMCHKCDIMFKNKRTLNIHIKKGQCML